MGKIKSSDKYDALSIMANLELNGLGENDYISFVTDNRSLLNKVVEITDDNRDEIQDLTNSTIFKLFGTEIGEGFFKDSNKIILSFPDLKNQVFSGMDYDELLFHIRQRDIPIIKEQIRKKNPDLEESALDSAIEFLDSLESNPDMNRYVADCIRWLKNGRIRLPEDNDVVIESFIQARKRNIDTQKYKSPLDLIRDVIVEMNNENQLTEPKPIDPTQDSNSTM